VNKSLGRELLIEIIADSYGVLNDETVSRAISALYNRGIRPDRWQLEPIRSAKAWENSENSAQGRTTDL
jgi:5-dehydro-2-deoxygluconokinase